MRVLLTVLCLACAWATALASEEQTRLDLLLFDGGTPLAGVQVRVNGEVLGLTDENGAFSGNIPVGQTQLRLERGDQTLGGLQLTGEASLPIQVIGALPEQPGGNMRFDVEGAARGISSGGDDSLASGTLKGRVLSTEDDTPVAGAQVYFSGVEARATTDALGQFNAQLPEGEYRLSVVHPNFSTQNQAGVQIIGEQESSIQLELSPAGLLLSEFSVVAPHLEGSVASVFSQQRDGAGVSEVLGAEQMSRSGDSTAADALKRVTGLTIEDGKFVVVRGQPARYTQTLWNGSPLPSPDPIRRIVPLDMFPTGSLASINVEKSYHADAPGSFGGGLIRLETAGVPDEAFAEVSASVNINTQTTGETGFDYEGGSRDILGSDDGTRKLPSSLGIDRTSAEVTEAASGFTGIWNIDDQAIGPDTSLGLAAGRRFKALGGELGIRGGFNWSRSFDYREILKRDFALAGDGSLAVRNDQVETRTDMNVDVGGMFVSALEWDQHALRSNTFLARKSVKRSSITEGTRVVSDDLFIRDHLLEWNERELFAQQLLGEHDFNWIEVDWRGMLARSERDSPDRRNYIYRRQSNGDFVFFNQARAGRRFDNSEDDIVSLDIDFKLPLLDSRGWRMDLLAGVSRFTQDRESQTRRFSFQTTNNPDLTLPPDILLDPDNLGDTLAVTDQTQTNDNYIGKASVDGMYLSMDIDWADSVRLTLGARQEQADFSVRTFIAGGSQGGQEVSGGFEDDNLLPSLSLTWRFIEDMQLRFSGSRTLSRPVLNELSPARYFDPDSGEEFLGNSDLKPAIIESVDLRWEWYPSGRESVSLGIFNKDYTDPIEQSFVGVGGSSFLRQVQNAAGATVSGTEVSARADLNRLTGLFNYQRPWVDKTYIQANAAFIESEVELARQDLATEVNRPLQGQADVVYNLQIGYDGERHDANLSWNLVGERLHLAGVQGQPDVFQNSVAQLDANYSFQWTDRFKVKFSVSNLLNPDIKFTQGGRLFRAYTRGMDLSASVGWRF